MPRTGLRRLSSRAELAAWRAEQDPKRPIRLVPTMGALHVGHDALFDLACADGGLGIASVFVNPLQFERADDLAAYPRTLEDDCARLEARGIEAIYHPEVEDMYGPDFQTTLAPGAGGEGFEGVARPGHFAGMLTVVHKLFLRVRPDEAVFGEKDAQQLFLVRRMVTDLDLPVRIVPCPTVREPDGLALSSRNVHLGAEGRQRALGLSRALDAVAASFASGEREVARLESTLRAVMEEHGVTVAYASIVDEERFLAPAPDLPGSRSWRAVIAGRVDEVHLLDNRFLGEA